MVKYHAEALRAACVHSGICRPGSRAPSPKVRGERGPEMTCIARFEPEMEAGRTPGEGKEGLLSDDGWEFLQGVHDTPPERPGIPGWQGQVLPESGSRPDRRFSLPNPMNILPSSRFSCSFRDSSTPGMCREGGETAPNPCRVGHRGRRALPPALSGSGDGDGGADIWQRGAGQPACTVGCAWVKSHGDMEARIRGGFREMPGAKGPADSCALSQVTESGRAGGFRTGERHWQNDGKGGKWGGTGTEASGRQSRFPPEVGNGEII